MPFVKLDCKILQSTLWLDVDARWVFITALLMARPWYTEECLPQLFVNRLEPTGWDVPPGCYGLIEAAGPCIAAEAGVTGVNGEKALERLGAPDPFSRSGEYEGRRLVRVNHGYIALNYMRYRDTRDEDLKREYMRDYMARKRAEEPEYGRKSSKNKDSQKVPVGKMRLTSGKPMLAPVGAVSPRLAQAEAEGGVTPPLNPPVIHIQKADVEVVGANGAPDDAPRHAKKLNGKRCPHQAIIDLYHEILPMCVHVGDWTPTRAAVLAARWREDPKRQNLEWWRGYFTFVATSKFLTGRAPATNGRKPFRASLPWLTRLENLVKVAEDQYA